MMRRILIPHIMLLLILACCPHAHAQLQAWRHINTSDMANINVICITQDAAGSMYFGTHDGISVYDGLHFHQVTVPGMISRGLNPFVNSMRWDAKGLLWVSTRSHIYSYDPVKDKVHIANDPTVLSEAMSSVGTELDTAHQQLYVFGSKITVYDITDTGLRFARSFVLPHIEEKVMTNKGVLYAVSNGQLLKVSGTTAQPIYTTSFIKDIGYLPKRNAIAMITGNGIELFDISTGTTKHLRDVTGWNITSTKCHMAILADDEVAILHEKGLCLIDTKSGRSVTYTKNEKNPAGVRNDYINCIFSDRNKDLWIAEDGIGISVLAHRARSTQFLPAAMIGSARLWGLFHDSAHHQFFSSSEKGLCAVSYAGDTLSYRPFIKPPGTGNFEVMGYMPWAKDVLLLVTNGQGSWLLNTTSLSLRPFDTLNRQLQQRALWGMTTFRPGEYILYATTGTYYYQRKSGVVTEFRKENDSTVKGTYNGAGIYSNLVAHTDKRRRIWFGSVYGVDVRDSTFKMIAHFGGNDVTRNKGLNNNVILDIKESADGSIYVASMGGGAYVLNKEETSFMPVPLVGDPAIIYCISIVDDQHLVFSTSNGLYLYDVRTKTSAVLNERNGLPNTDFNQNGLWYDHGFLIAAGSKGIVMIPAKDMQAYFKDTGRIQVLQHGHSVQQITLNKGTHTLDADIAIIAGTDARWKLQYRLDDVDDDWRSMAKDEWHIHYNSLAPGEYTLHIQALDEQNVVHTSAIAVKITALPFFWQTLWFRAIISIMAIGLLIWVVRFFSQLSLKWKLKKLEDEQKITRERLRISRELHDNVGSQLTYLITGLESSGILLHKQETGTLEKKIEKMQSTARESMQQLRDSIWALNNEYVAASVLLSRFEKWLANIMDAFSEIKYELHSSVGNDVQLDPLKSLNLFRIMQEAVHNVLKHAQATRLDVSYTVSHDRLAITIKDNGKGFDLNGPAGNGRRTMMDRATEIGASYAIAADHGTTVSITMDLK